MVGLIGSALVLGAAFGAAFGGPAADRFGRKPAFFVDMAILAAGASLSAFPNAPGLDLLAGQFLVGIGIGIDFPVSASYVSETMPKSARSRMMVATIALQSVGMLVGAAVALTTLGGLGQSGRHGGRSWARPGSVHVCSCWRGCGFRKVRAG